MRRIMGIDYGDARVGVAVSDPLGITAQGVATLANKVFDNMLRSLDKLILEYAPKTIVLGLPKNMDGTEGVRAEISNQFAKILKDTYPDISVVLWDERLTTVLADRYLSATKTRGKQRKQVVDTVAASLILQSYLDQNSVK